MLGAKILVGIQFCWQFLRRFGRILDSTSPSISQHHCNSVAFHTMSKSKVCFWLGRPYKRIITSIDFSRAPLHILISDCCGEAARFDFIWFSPHNLYVCGVSWSFGMGTWLGPPMDQRGSRRVCGRIWLRSAGQWEFFWGGSCRWSVVMAGVNQSAVTKSIWKTSKLSSCPAMLSWRSDFSWSYQVSNLILLARYSCEVGCHLKTNPWRNSFWFWQTGFSTFFSYDFFVFSDLLAWESVGIGTILA